MPRLAEEHPMRREKPGLSVFFPAYNDAGTIASLAIVAHMTARELTDDHEVIVVDDGSPDHTGELLDEMARVYPWLRVVHHGQNRGYGGALRSGFQAARKELVFYTDGDAQYDPREMRALYEALSPGVDFVNGYKISRQDPLHRVVIGRLYHWLVKLAFGLRLRDVDCDFRLMRRSVFDKVTLTRSSGVICVELMKKVQDHGFRIAEVPVHHFHRSYGKSQFFNFRRVGRTLVDLGRLWLELVVRPAAPEARDRAQPGRRSLPGGDDGCRQAVSDHREFYAGRRVLVTGGLGFIGSNLCRALAEVGAAVTAVDSLLPDYGGNLFNLAGYEDRVRINIADVRGHGMEYLVRGQDVLFNLAGQVSHLDSMQDPVTDLEINCTSQLKLLEAVRRGNPELKIVYAGTRQIYGRPLYLPVDERHLLQPVDVNGINKISGEFYHLVYHQVYGIRASSLRLTNTYGPRQLIKHNRQGFIGWFVRQAAFGEEILVFGDGRQKRDLNHVDDVVDAFLRAGAMDAADGQVFNLGDARPLSLLALVELLVEVAGGGRYRLVPFPPERARIDIGDFHADTGKARAVLGWEPRVPLRSGLADTIAYYRAHREHYL